MYRAGLKTNGRIYFLLTTWKNSKNKKYLLTQRKKKRKTKTLEERKPTTSSLILPRSNVIVDGVSGLWIGLTAKSPRRYSE